MPGDDDPLPKVTLSMLRDPRRGCSWRLSRTYAGATGNRGGTGRWVVRDRLEEAIRHAHATGGDPRSRLRTVDDDTLGVEERAVLTAALAWYVELFPDAVEILPAAGWEQAFEEPGVRLAGPAPLVVRPAGSATPGGGASGGRATGSGPTGEPVEIRMLRLGEAPPAPPIAATPDVRAAILLLDAPVPDRLVVSIADLLHGRRVREDLRGPAARLEAEAWLANAVEELRSRIADPRPRTGVECGWCPHVAGCPAHRERLDPAAASPT